MKDALLTYTERTALQGKVRHEVNCVAVMNQESERLLAERTAEAMEPKVKTIYHGKGRDIVDLGSSFIQPGSIAAQDKWGGFIVSLHSEHSILHTYSLLEKGWCSTDRQETANAQDCSYASERAAGQDIRMFQRIQLLVYESLPRSPAATRSLPAGDVGSDSYTAQKRTFRLALLTKARK